MNFHRLSILIICTLLMIFVSTGISFADPGDEFSSNGITSYAESGIVMDALTADSQAEGEVPGSVQSELAAVAMNEGFEGSWSAVNWTVSDVSSADGGEFVWGQRNCSPRTGTSSVWIVGGGAQGSSLPCEGNYPNNTAIRALYGPIDLSKATSASMSYYIRGRTENTAGCTSDYLGVASGTSTSGSFTGNAPECGDLTSGNAGNGYYQRTLNLNNRLGQSLVWVAFFFISDDTGTDIGFTIDDITLKIDTTPTATYGAYLPAIFTSSPPLTNPLNLNLCFDSQRSPQTYLTQQSCKLGGSVQFYLYSGSSLAKRDFEFPLSGDIVGSTYVFNVHLATLGKANIEVSALVVQNGTETTLASRTFSVNSTIYSAFNATLKGVNPTTRSGDKLILRVRSLAGSSTSGLLIADNRQSYLTIK